MYPTLSTTAMAIKGKVAMWNDNSDTGQLGSLL